MKAILGRKVGMTQLFDANGAALPVTVIEAGPCPVFQRKTEESDGYNAVVLAFEEASNLNKPSLGRFVKRNMVPRKVLREIRGTFDVAEGTDITVAAFAPGDKVQVRGTTKGRGFTGTMKRWRFSGLPASHGVEKRHRAPGSIGQHTNPGHVFKGQKMSGRYGGERVSTANLTVVQVDPENNLIAICGAVPGGKNGLLLIKSMELVGRA